ncbi:DUF2336 domain-containing protein [Acidisphaera sp. L21]|uniref:DUF2336 domain-containing protein n=1 Tax=Acidisphaera sp. L21 TaxID=1641851 RepID=UPI00131CC4FA|nr:DUF2336 domain-containing protein [Acidisphaera sp. L21]
MSTDTVARALLDLDVRVKLAANPATPSDILTFLARDTAVTVRAAVALNPSVTAAADRRLAGDGDERVRMLLARKLAKALPGLSGPTEREMRERTLGILSTLVRDEAVRIRAAIAVIVAAMPDLPRDIVLALANDAAVSVSEPVLRLSPLLSTDDLLALLHTPPHDATATAIACRSNLPPEVADAIAASADSAAIQALLANKSAAIMESTLDVLIARAENEPEWHEPLVQRPWLSDNAARALSGIVADHLLKILAERSDITPSVVAEIQQRLAKQLAKGVAPITRVSDEALMEEARYLDTMGELTEDMLLAALRAGDVRRASTLLAVAASVTLSVMDRAASLRSAKALVSLVWKAGFSIRAAGSVQAVIGQLGPDEVMAASASGGYPLTPEELGWQLDFLGCRRS